MISHSSHSWTDARSFADFLRGAAASEAGVRARSTLVQIYCADGDADQLRTIANAAADALPEAVVVGATTVGEIIHGGLRTNSTVIGVTFFDLARLAVRDVSCENDDPQRVGAELGRMIAEIEGPIAGVLLLATPLSIDAPALLNGLEERASHLKIFGGGAGDYAAMATSLVSCGERQHRKGAVAVVFAGDGVHVETRSALGWRPLSMEMRIDEVDGSTVRTIDGRPAFEVYRRYLNIPRDEKFFLNALEFPFLMEREGELIARVPVAASPEGALQFVADVMEGETFRIGYGDIDLIVDGAAAIRREIAAEAPQAIFLYSCGCRRFLMQDEVDIETRPFEEVAPTFGFYTYGEFCSTATGLNLLNSAMVVVGLREGPARNRAVSDRVAERDEDPPASDPYANKHTRIVTRLMRFINVVTAELEASNREIAKLSMTDHLTGLANRVRLDQVLAENRQLASRYDTPFSIVMLDLDHFKQVNDLHGHLAGDEVLRAAATTLSAVTRETDTVGRWGGEEFMIVAPNTSLDDAGRLAEKLRAAIRDREWPFIGGMTASFGVASFETGEDVGGLVRRADAALYRAKEEGRDRVASA